VHIVEVNQKSVAAGLQRIEQSVARAEGRGRIASADHVLAKISLANDLESFRDCDLVVEAIVEDEQAKVSLVADLDRVVRHEDTILAANTSSIPIMKLAVSTGCPQNVVGLHFFNPVPVLDLVEVVPSLLTSEETVEAARTFAEQQLGKQTILCRDRAGFVVNALLIPFLLSVIRMVESGFATAGHIDRGLTLGAAHPMGPLALADLIGLDTTKAVADSLYEEFKEPLHAAPSLPGADGGCRTSRTRVRARFLHLLTYSLEEQRHPLTATDAQRRESVAAAADLQIVDQASDQP